MLDGTVCHRREDSWQKATLWQYSGMWSQYLRTTVSLTTFSLAKTSQWFCFSNQGPLSINCRSGTRSDPFN